MEMSGFTIESMDASGAWQATDGLLRQDREHAINEAKDMHLKRATHFRVRNERGGTLWNSADEGAGQ
jgi:hypothetical protein